MTQAFPLQWPEGWPRAKARKRAKFTAAGSSNPLTGYRPTRQLSVSDGLTRVGYELNRLNVAQEPGNIIVSTNIVLRNDGYPRSGQAEPADPGVAVYWKSLGGARQVMAIDLYDRVADNLAAIAATLEAMRAIERHGGAQIMERAFTGFAALPPPNDCWKELGLSPGASAAAIDAAHRNKLMACRRTHPMGDHPSEGAINAARDEALKLVKP